MVTLAGQHHPLASTEEQLRILHEPTTAHKPFEESLAESGLSPLRATGIETLQINVGKLCNQTCRHCHVDAGPDRVESMSRETAELCMEKLAATDIPTVDITGGAPELNSSFRWLVRESKRLGRHVMDRCNLTILLVSSQDDLAEFLAEHQVEIVASLPFYSAEQTDVQRGEKVFERSIRALRKLNDLGYGKDGAGLKLDLVFNPAGAFLPPAQRALEEDFKRELKRRHGITFNNLYTITNMPISRFLEFLLRTGNYDRYMRKLVRAYNPAAAAAVMCRSMISVAWDGTLSDCDFNQMIDLSTGPGLPHHIRDFDYELLKQRRIVTDQHCYGCTAGAGSSCGGTIA